LKLVLLGGAFNKADTQTTGCRKKRNSVEAIPRGCCQKIWKGGGGGTSTSSLNGKLIRHQQRDGKDTARQEKLSRRVSGQARRTWKGHQQKEAATILSIPKGAGGKS